MNKTFQKYEYQRIAVNERNSDGFQFNERHYAALCKFNERNEGKFFEIEYRKIRFTNYVGLLQVGDCTIEVLPKIDRLTQDEEKPKWRSALIRMLKLCRKLQLESTTESRASLQNETLFEIYINEYLNEMERLVREGLTKKYRLIQDNVPFCKGKLMLDRQLRENLVHKERFCVEYDTYDFDNPFNQILYAALQILKTFPVAPKFTDRIGRLEFQLPEITLKKITAEDFQKLPIDRKTEKYKYALTLARLIIMEYTPDIKAGSENILAILFEMEKLFEEFVYRLLYRYKESDWEVTAQTSRKFWKTDNCTKHIRPDILLKYSGKNLIIDTKWKVPKQGIASDDDLKQMYAYNQFYDAEHSILLYPKLEKSVKGRFCKENQNHACSMEGVQLYFNGSGTKLDLLKTGDELKKIVSNYL
ncbi:MAG: restriction endonuclease [Candidatus Wallbacteria bacterium]|nr:restriction endonuclease [Candidatus Wallbacteria bacterium]